VATFANYAATTAGNVSYTWYGRVGNTATGALLPDGEYQVKAFATSGGSILDFDYQDVTLDSNAVVGTPPVITNLLVDPTSFSALDGGSTEVSFDVNEGAYVTVEVRDGSDVVRTYSAYDGNDWYLASHDHSVLWDGKTTGGSVVADGYYTVSVTATDSDGSDNETVSVQVSTSGVTNDGVIEDFEINPRTDWDPSDEDLEIEFELTEDVDDLVIEAVKGNEVIEIMDENDASDGDYEEYWDGTDEDGDYVEEGIWTIRVTANGDMVSQTVEVDYYTPEIITAFVTKSSIDPSEGEFTNLVFEIDEDAIVTVEVYDGTRRELTLMDEEEVSGNRYYAVMWDGLDDDGDDLDDGDYTFKITAENPVDDDIYSTKTLNIELDEDKVSSRKSNATNDYTDPVIFDEDGYHSIEISYCLDQDAEVYLAVYDGTSTTGTPEIVLLDYLAQSAGCHTVQWDGRDDDGRDLDEGVNSYKLITKIGSYKDTEVGKFAVGGVGTVVPVVGTPVFYEGSACYNYYRDLDYLSASNELCQAIAWGTEEGIWHGYPDGTFKPYDIINRAEILKVALETFEVNLFPMSGSTEGFSDVDPYAWYMPYVRTAKFYGMFHGYPDGTAKLDQDINRVELLKIVLEASAKFTSYEFEDALNARFYADVDPDGSDWYYAYANTAYHYDLYNTAYVDGLAYLRPGQLVERGEVALLLYRMHKAGLLNE
jgi:flagellar hook assembly protein FlgD